MLVFNILSILLVAYFDFCRLELKREPLNCPVDRNILIRDTVSDLLQRGVNRGMQIHRSVVFFGPIRRSDLIFVQIRIRVTLKNFVVYRK